MFRYLLVLPDGEPHDPASWETLVPNWSVGETIMLGEGEQLRILGIQTEIAVELVDHRINGVLHRRAGRVNRIGPVARRTDKN